MVKGHSKHGVLQTQWQKQQSGPQSTQDLQKKVDRTIGWYNRHGGLAAPIDFKKVSSTLHAIHPEQALKVLKGLEGKEATIRNPTAWVQKAAAAQVSDLDPKVQKTISWYNKHGGLKTEIHFQTVKPLLAALPVPVALKLLKGLEDKVHEINDPTAWISAGAAKQLQRVGGTVMEVDSWGGKGAGKTVPPPRLYATSNYGGDGATSNSGSDSAGWNKVEKTIKWYNRNGGLQQEIIYEEVVPFLEAVGTTAALQILKGLDGKGDGIQNPTAWIRSATVRQMSG